ncbi:MAG TPA: hypothetical protein VF021_08810 [Longimicrobiales bacterium]
MRRLVERFGADYDQWRALTRVGLKLDLRATRGAIAPRSGAGRNRVLPQLLFYFVTGILLAGVVAMTTDVFLAALIMVTYAIFMVGVMVLLEYHTVVTAPDDYVILGFQPVSSRTYFAARITNLLLIVLTLSTAISLPSAGVLMLRAGFQPAVGAALLLGVWIAACTTAMAMVLVYGSLVQRVPAQRLARALTYLQLTVSFVLYGGYMLLPELFQRLGVAHMALPKTSTVLLFPPTWFASYVDIARAQVGPREVIPALAAVALLMVVARAASGKISLEFAERLAGITVSAPPRRARASGAAIAPAWLRAGEARAVWILLRNQFRSDQKFRMSVLGILPLTVLYMLMAIGKGGVPDPFGGRTGAGGSAALIYMAVIMFPVMLNTTITHSDNYKAAWIFYATAADREKTIVAMKNVVFLLFVVPYLVFTGAVFVFWFHNIAHALVHTLLLALLSHLALVLLLLFDPQMPFSRPINKGERSARLFFLTAASAIFSSIAIPLTARFVYISVARTVLLLLTLWLLGAALQRAGQSRMRRELLASEFVG